MTSNSFLRFGDDMAESNLPAPKNLEVTSHPSPQPPVFVSMFQLRQFSRLASRFSPPVAKRLFSTMEVSQDGLSTFAVEENGQKWLLRAACLLTRRPMVEPLAPAWKVEYETHMEAVRSARYKHLGEEVFRSPHASQQRPADASEEVVEEGSPLTRAELWKAAPVSNPTVDADLSNPNRMVGEFLYMMVQEAGSDQWVLPSVARKDGETMKDASERCMNALFEENDIWFESVANAPLLHWEESSSNARMFVFKSLYISGGTQLVGAKKLAWLSADEICARISPDSELAPLLPLLQRNRYVQTDASFTVHPPPNLTS
jgi:hypothetical protein